MPDYQFNTNLGPAQQQGTNIGDMLNIARGAQAYQQAQQVNPLELRAKQLEVQKAEQMNPLAVRKATAETQGSEFELNAKQTQALYNLAGGVMNDKRLDSNKPAEVIGVINEAKKRAHTLGIPEITVEGVFAPLMNQAVSNPSSVKQVIGNIIQSGLGPANQQALQTPQLTTNAAGQLVTVQPMQNKVGVLGESSQPTAPTGVTPQAMARPQGAPMSANPSTAQAGLLNKATDTSANDWAQTSSDASTAQGRIALYQNIKSLTPDSFTGVGGERKKFISGLAQSVGIPAYELETSTTDELTKNAKLLSLAGGNTDAARAIAEMASPNAKMTKDAINRVSDQLIGIEKMKQSKADFLAPYLTNPAQYQQKLQQFNQFSDFRLFQEMTPAEVAKLKRSMSTAEQQDMSRKIQQARQLGIIQ